MDYPYKEDPSPGCEHPGEWERIAENKWRRWLKDGEYEALIRAADLQQSKA
jgi:hypothetical protein